MSWLWEQIYNDTPWGIGIGLAVGMAGMLLLLWVADHAYEIGAKARQIQDEIKRRPKAS